MRTIARCLCLTLALAAPACSTAQSAPVHHDGPGHDGLSRVPQNILDGLDAVRRDHPNDAETVWRKDSSFLRQGAASSVLQNYRASDGEYQGFDLIAVQDITPRSRVIYLALNYQRQPHFAKFVVYHTAKEWVLLSLDLNVDMTTVQAELANKPQS